MTTEQSTKNRGGRPPTGETPKRQVRVGEEWDEAERLAAEMAVHLGHVDRDGNPKPFIAAYIRQALVLENARITKLLAKAAEKKELTV